MPTHQSQQDFPGCYVRSASDGAVLPRPLGLVRLEQRRFPRFHLDCHFRMFHRRVVGADNRHAEDICQLLLLLDGYHRLSVCAFRPLVGLGEPPAKPRQRSGDASRANSKARRESGSLHEACKVVAVLTGSAPGRVRQPWHREADVERLDDVAVDEGLLPHHFHGDVVTNLRHGHVSGERFFHEGLDGLPRAYLAAAWGCPVVGAGTGFRELLL
mmetsp:Transcript_66074/g.190669  ORF Transcript_66074/g.190669 Transcript_66074/m.190669 type:complete len:214 (+) Transcript_66074:1010-1651(+)